MPKVAPQCSLTVSSPEKFGPMVATSAMLFSIVLLILCFTRKKSCRRIARDSAQMNCAFGRWSKVKHTKTTPTMSTDISARTATYSDNANNKFYIYTENKKGPSFESPRQFEQTQEILTGDIKDACRIVDAFNVSSSEYIPNLCSQASDSLEVLSHSSQFTNHRKHFRRRFSHKNCSRLKKLKHARRVNWSLLKKYENYCRKRVGVCSNAEALWTNRQLGIEFIDQREKYRRKLECDEVPTNESPWVRACEILENKSCISKMSNSTVSTLRTASLPQISPRAKDLCNIMADLFLPSQNIVLKKIVLEGTFGLLYEAKLRILPDRKRIQNEQWKSVFVKTVSNQATNKQIQIFLQDACKMAGLRHKTLASMVATSKEEHQFGSGKSELSLRPWLIYSFAEFGNLKLFLRNSTHQRNITSITADQLLAMGLQLIDAVAFLHDIRIIHGDIATRNCLLGAKYSVKLSDCALSRDFFPDDYHCLGDNTNRPIKWLALEALIERKYTAATDVWSMGVTLWELITKGQQPYDLFDSFEMLNVLRSGYRMKQPSHCPDELWEIIRSCWKMPPTSRPTIDQLREMLQRFRQTVTQYI
ncbi:hypothetical protein EG68_04676 [Paragonimus skrjabini miyazakii]|uniref:Protein kinase domain-containing protein n=1 Tax=Paragonimus skrjabini miyazakii TaxID=59628 RepID=A0A8S9YRA2_9TREM|nr:hypothetical protein EG68_04676 [Paragonimus skrjabini miyazakii]